MRFGLPYKGSKNKIAPWIISNLPSADVFVDLFCGGGAITHCAMLTNKYKQFVMNDIDGRLPVLFKECAYGKHTIATHPEWITREEFNAKKGGHYKDAVYCSNECRNLSFSPIWEYNGEQHRVVEWAKIVGINAHCLIHRKELGWTIEEILTTPLRGRRNGKTKL